MLRTETHNVSYITQRMHGNIFEGHISPTRHHLYFKMAVSMVLFPLCKAIVILTWAAFEMYLCVSRRASGPGLAYIPPVVEIQLHNCVMFSDAPHIRTVQHLQGIAHF